MSERAAVRFTNRAAIAIVVSVALSCALYVWFVIRPIRLAVGSASAHAKRNSILLSIPVWCIFVVLPNTFDAQHSQTVGAIFTAAVITWWSSFKLLSFCLGGGPLHELSTVPGPRQGKIIPFIATLLLPIVLASLKPSDGGGSGDAAVPSSPRTRRPTVSEVWYLQIIRATAKLFVLFLLVFILERSDIALVHSACYLGCVYMGASLMMDGAASLFQLFGIIVNPHFDEPYKSYSFREFWANRWNITASIVLRDAVYLPILNAGRRTPPGTVVASDDIAAATRPSLQWRAFAVFVSFIASGLVHELILSYVNPVVTFEWTAYFVVNGAVCIAEDYFRVSKNHPITVWWKRTIPPSVQRLITLTALFILTETIFLPPLTRYGLNKRLIAEASVF